MFVTFFSWTCEACGCAPLDMWRCPCGHHRTIYAKPSESKPLAAFTVEDAMRDMRETIAMVRRLQFRVVKK